MPDIFHDFTIVAKRGAVFEAITTPAGSMNGGRKHRPASVTQVRFRHVGWPSTNDHYRISCYCWAAYLRILRRYLEHGERVPYEKRLDV